MTTSSIRNLVSWSPLRHGLLLIPLALACFALSPTAQAQLVPPPDGGYPVQNTAEGDEALFSLTSGSQNTAIGFRTLYSNTTGTQNTATGVAALLNNTTGTHNTATGNNALASNTTGGDNTATGLNAMPNNTTGVNNTANGVQTLDRNTTGSNNTANGVNALFNNTTGSVNAANGRDALFNNSTGDNNIAMGFGAGFNLTTGNNNIDIGNVGVAAEANTIRIGTLGTQTAIYLAGIMGKTVPRSTPVFVNSDGLLGTTTSSARFKDDIKPMDKASEKILALKPVTFRYKKQIDPDKTPQFGLIAEEVAKVNPALVLPDKEGKPYTVRYEAVNAMLLNEFLKEHRKVEKLEATVEGLAATVKEQAAQIQKVSAQLETSKPAPQVVNNP